MSEITIKKAKKLQGALIIPGDKSISHRAALLSLLCCDKIEIENYSDAVDCKNSLDAVAALGATVSSEQDTVTITPPHDGLKSPEKPIDCGNSGTTMRLLAGLLAGANVSASLIGDESLSQRPMSRIIEPLKKMNAQVSSTEAGTAPLVIDPSPIIPIDYTLPIPSAQVKSAILLAGLVSGTKTVVREQVISRDHTERMISFLGGKIEIDDIKAQIIPDPDDPRKKKRVLPTDKYKRAITVSLSEKLDGGKITVPGDFSTAAFFIAAGLMIKGSHIILKNIGINPTRIGFLTVLRQMGAKIELKNRREICGEPTADIEVVYCPLKPRKIAGDIIPKLIDEIPIIAVLAASLNGTTVIRDAEELRHKECDRIHATVKNLEALGVKVGEFPDGIAIEGIGDLEAGEVDSFGDHRIAMAFGVAAMAAHGTTTIKRSDAVDISCPKFFNMLEGLRLK
ncbi:MAG: 3-phosphoshikimate 1-carboxyvinyltransferase [candidate division Zixibacteria bacterium]|nr:3-phosphoshikimate 1-carboxyvinyltransferase [candidate division Zixibacteria bacterium]